LAIAARNEPERRSTIRSGSSGGKAINEAGADWSVLLRLMGLPHVARFPRATVTREEGSFQLLFHGGEHSRRVDVDLRYLDDADDLEATELRLLARLQQLGYEVERGPSPEGGAGS
jgi:hypothetical protein